MQTGDYESALKDFNKALELSPDMPNVVTNRAELYLRTNKLEEAIAECSRAIIADDTDADSFITRGDARAKAGNIKEALQDYTCAIDLNPDPVNMFHPEGYSYSKRAAILESQGQKAAAASDRAAAKMFGYQER